MKYHSLSKQICKFALLFLPFTLGAFFASATVEDGERASEGAYASRDDSRFTGNNRALLITDFLYVYNINRAIIRFGAPIPFSTNGAIAGGLTHAAGDTAIFVANAGFYKINFYISGTGIDTFAVSVNGVIDNTTIYSSSGNQIVAQAIIAIPDNSIISIQNLSRTAVILHSPIRPPIWINASLTVERYL